MRYEDIPTLSTWTTDSTAAPNVAAMAARWTAQAPVAVTGAAPARPARFAETDTLVDLYGKSFQAMSKRNILYDLKTELAATFPNPATESLAVRALIEVVNRKLTGLPAAGRYTHTTCIAWNIGCNDATTGTYFKHSANDEVDMNRKCDEMYRAICQAEQRIAASGTDNANTLKIFLAPEFFFRGENGAYPPELVSKIIPKMRALGTGSARFSDWLFVFGTAIAAIEVDRTYCVNCTPGTTLLHNVGNTIRHERDPANPGKTIAKCQNETVPGTHNVQVLTFGAEVQNVSLIQHGAETAMVAKEWVSSIDYDDYTGAAHSAGHVTVHANTLAEAGREVLIPSGSTDTQWGANPDGIVTQNDERLGGCRLTIGGVRIAVEICLDHAHGIARASALENSNQILLIPSFGMTIGATDATGVFRPGQYTMPNGIIFNVDGRGTGVSELQVKGLPVPTVAPTGAPTVMTAFGSRGTVDIWAPIAIP